MEDGTDEPRTGQRSEMAAKLGRIAGLHARAAARRAESFVADHETELRTAGLAAAQFAASRVGHPVLRPVMQAAAAEFARGAARPPDNQSDNAGSADDDGSGDQRPQG